MVEMTTNVDVPRAEIEELKNNTFWWSVSGLFLAAIALYLFARTFPDPMYGAVPGLLFLLLSPVVWLFG